MQKSPRNPKTDLKLHQRDLAVLSWMCEQYAARMDHLETLMGTGSTRTRDLVARLRAAELVRTERILVGHPTWVIPTHKGLSVCGARYWVWKPKLGALAHISALNDVRLHIQAQKAESVWLSERQLLAEAKERTGARSHAPDGVLILGARSVAIEVELSIKSIRRVEAILDDLTGRFDGILYYCATRPHRQLTQLEESGRWRALGVRELPRQTGLEWL